MKCKSRLFASSILFVGGSAFATSLNIPDYSFENPSIPSGTTQDESNSYFGNAWTTTLFCDLYNPANDGVGSSGNTWATPVPDGSQVLEINGAGDPYDVQVDQVIPNTFSVGQIYTMSVWVGNTWGNTDPMTYALRFFGENGSTTNYMELATDQTNPVANGQWVDVTDTFTVQPNRALVGNGQIEINFTNGLGYDPNPGSGNIYIDDVRISVATPVTWNNSNGSGDGATWDSASNNWNNGTSVTTYSDGDPVTFNDTNNSHYAVTLNSTVNPSSVTVNNSGGNYSITGSGEIVDTGSFTKSGSGTFTLGTAMAAGNANIIGGTVALATGVTAGSGTATSNVTFASLTLAGNGVLDITNNHIIINYGASDPLQTLYGYLQTGYNNGAWNGVGPSIISSAAATENATSGLKYGIGFADGADKVVTGLSSGQIELKYTLLGDANLDGTVNGSDFSILAANFGLGVTNWDQGNFLYGSSVNGSDFSALAANFGQGDSGAATSVTSADVAALDAFAAANGLQAPTFAAVPEPASLAATAAVLAVVSSRRRRQPRSN